MTLQVGQPFDAAPFAQCLDSDVGLAWEDPRELHRVVVEFGGPVPMDLRLGYWRTRWPQQRLPKAQIPSGGDYGWWELGNWFTGEWRVADTALTVDGSTATLVFRPIHQKEFPDLSEFPATYRTTLQIHLVADGPLPPVHTIAAYTDSTWEQQTVTLLWQTQPRRAPCFCVFNGHLETVRQIAPSIWTVTLWRARNADPNTFDKTLLTAEADDTFTVLLDDLEGGTIDIQDYGVCVVEGWEERDYAAVCSRARIHALPGVHDAVAGLPEQTWPRAWRNMVAKRERLYLPLGTDGGRHKFALQPDGSVLYRTNPEYLVRCPGRDTARLQNDASHLSVSFGLPNTPGERSLADGTLPIAITTWELPQLRVRQVAFATLLEGMEPAGLPMPGDAHGVLMARFFFENTSTGQNRAQMPLRFAAGRLSEQVTLDLDSLVWSGDRLRGEVCVDGAAQVSADQEGLCFAATLAPGERCELVLKLPYMWLEGDEIQRLQKLAFDHERQAVTAYWRQRFDTGTKLITPEADLNQLYAAHAGHLLINCERSPGDERRFARVGSLRYGAYGNESCMMIVDLDRRGYHREARECLQAFLVGQGTVALPGRFQSQQGVLYGAGGYEAGGYNQHHGWILWCLVEHFRFTRDREWLVAIVDNLMAAAEWIIRERDRTVGSDEIGAGLLPPGGLEDVGDWWQWLSTNAYTWRGLDAAAWALTQISYPHAARLRLEADDYRSAILGAFGDAARRSPVVRLRNGIFVPHFPSHVHRRGRHFGWICETLEGAIHLLIAGVLDPAGREARWILQDYEDNLYLSPQYSYDVEPFDEHWFDWGGFSMQACLLLGVEPYLYRDEVKHALRAAFNAIAAGYFPDTRMLTEHALPRLGDWRGDHYKSSDEANAAGWLRHLFVREDGDELILGQAVPRDWLRPGQRAGVIGAHTYFGPVSLLYEADSEGIIARLNGPKRNPPCRLRLRFRHPAARIARSIRVNGREWRDRADEWVVLPGDAGDAEIRAAY